MGQSAHNATATAVANTTNTASWWVRWRGEMTNIAFVSPAFVFLAILFVYPVASFLLRGVFDPGFTLEHYARVFMTSAYREVVWYTIKISGITTIVCLLMAYPMAMVMANASTRIRYVLFVFVLIPFWTNVLARMYGWMVLLGRNGVINQFLQGIGLTDEPVSLMFNEFGVVVGMAHYMLPFMILPLYSVMSGIGSDLIQAGHTLGAGPVRAFWRIYFPLSLPGVGAGCILVFIISAGFFVTPALLGGPQNTMISQLIEQQANQTFNWAFAAALSGTLLLIGLIFYIGYNRFLSEERWYGSR